MLIPKGFVWVLVDEKGEMVESLGEYYVFTTRRLARMALDDGERVIKVKIEVVGG